MHPLLILLFSFLQWFTGATSPGGPQQAELLFVGDAMQHQAQLDEALRLGGGKRYDYSDCFTLIAPEVIKADYAVVNLEVPLGGGPRYSGYPCFSAPDSYAEALQDAGFDLFLTANNHCLDRGDAGVRRTVKTLTSMGVDHTGTWHDAADRAATPPLVRNINGIKVGFANYTYGTNGIAPKAGAEIALIDKKAMALEVTALRKAGAEIVCVCIHWGVEYQLTEHASQRETAQYLADLGVDLIIGSHPHVIQPMKVMHNVKTGKDVLVVYSLGNFISNMKTGPTRGGALVKVRLTRAKDGTVTWSAPVYDTFYSSKPCAELRNYQVIPSWLSDLIPPAQRSWWNTFNNSAERIFSLHNVGVPRMEAPNVGTHPDASETR